MIRKKKFVLLISIVFVSLNVRGQRTQLAHDSDLYFPVAKIATPFRTDSLLKYVRISGSDTLNNFIAIDSMYTQILKVTHKFNEVLIFNQKGAAYKLHPDAKCVNNTILLKNLSLNNIDTAKKLDSFLMCIQPISATKINKDYLTAIIFWNFSNRTYKDDQPFDWEKILRTRYKDKVNILKVNTDVNESWSPFYKEKHLKFMQRILNAHNASLN